MNTIATKPKKSLSVYSLALMTVVAIDNIRNLPINAEYGLAIITFYLLGSLLFMIPTALVAAELATAWPSRGGVYVWVKQAFGDNCALLEIWLLWVYNIVWYPTILAFIVGSFLYLVEPQLINNRLVMLTGVLSLFWLSTLLNCFGMRLSSLISTLGALLGTLTPIVLLIVLGGIWIYQGHPLHIHLAPEYLIPNLSDPKQFAFLTAILFGMIGMEMSALHADEVHNPQRDYPRAMFIACFIILGTMIFASLAVASVVPAGQLSLVGGLIQAFQLFLDSFHMHWLLPLITSLVILGSFASVTTWIIGPTKGMLAAAENGSLPKALAKTNRHNVPVRLLILQGLISTGLSFVFILLPSVNSSYWFLSDLTAQLALVFYVILFAAAIKLRIDYPDTPRAFKIPGGKWGMNLVSGCGILTCTGIFILGFFPPAQLNVGNSLTYVLALVAGNVLFCLIPLLVIFRRKR